MCLSVFCLPGVCITCRSSNRIGEDYTEAEVEVVASPQALFDRVGQHVRMYRYDLVAPLASVSKPFVARTINVSTVWSIQVSLLVDFVGHQGSRCRTWGTNSQPQQAR